MRVVAKLVVLVLALASVAVGCDSDGQRVADSRLGVDDLRPLVTLSPEETGWPWPVDPQARLTSPAAFEFDHSDPSYAIQKALADAYDDAGIEKHATSSWHDGTKKASSFANLVATPAGATSALAAEHAFARAWFPDFEHQLIIDTAAAGIGEQSWAVRGGTGDAGFAEIGWTRANATFAVYVSCNPCDSDVVDAARMWAEKIDTAAHTAAR